MKIVNRQPIKTADVSSNRGQTWNELWKLFLWAALLVVAVFFSIGWIVDLTVPFITPEREASFFSPWQPGGKSTSEDAARLEPAQTMLDQLVSDPAVPHLPYRLILIEDQRPNAFAFPGGTIGLTSGLLDSTENPVALAFVLAHELGHFQNRDHLRGLGRTIGHGIAFSILFGGEMGSSQLPDTFNYVLGRSYSRKQEAAADRFGIGLVYRTLGETDGCDELFRNLQKDDTLPDWAYMFTTHPLPQKRIDRLQQEVDRLQHAQR